MARAMANGSTGWSVGSIASAPRIAERRAGASRSTPIEGAVEHPGQPRPGQLDLGLDAAQAQDPAVRLVGGDQRGGLVEHRRLADPGLTDDRQRPALTDRGPRGKGDDGVDHVLAASQRRRTVV